MQRKWLVRQGEQTLGPFTAGEMKALAAEGKIAPTDSIWREGDDPSKAVPAVQALKFPTAPKQETPQPPQALQADPGPTAGNKKKRGAAPGVKKSKNTIEQAVPVAPLPEPVHAVPPSQLPQGEPIPAVPLPEPVPANPLPEPVPAIPVLEAVPIPPAVAAVYEDNLTFQERYRRACSALSQWADRDDNVELVMSADTEAICRHPDVLDILRPFQDLPFEVLERLMEHLDLMVENRAAYYREAARRGREQ